MFPLHARMASDEHHQRGGGAQLSVNGVSGGGGVSGSGVGVGTANGNGIGSTTGTAAGTGTGTGTGVGEGRTRERSRHKSRRKKPWRKLLWVKQNYPDNWVDSSFLNQLQRNVNVQPYDFWTLVSDSTVITQHVSSVVVFVTTFIAIFTDKVGPVTVAGGSSFLTVLGYLVWDMGWEGREGGGMREGGGGGGGAGGKKRRGREGGDSLHPKGAQSRPQSRPTSRAASPSPSLHNHNQTRPALSRSNSGLSLRIPDSHHSHQTHSRGPSSPHPHSPVKSNNSNIPADSNSPILMHPPPRVRSLSPRSAQRERTRRRLDTAKSAGLIYCTLLGISPILRSLTESISSDSIWAMATWLFLANCMAFDYSSGVDVKFPASLSTNAAIMASVVLASRLPTTTHVFSLVLFSIQVFGLFPVFRRYLRHRSWNAHVTLTVVLVAGAAAGLGWVAGWGWAALYVVLLVGGGMGGCSWWLMWLQRYKNEINGPWDPARPVIRRTWES